jgi:UMF1 family MFS transporter
MNRRQVWSWALFDLANSVYPAVVTTVVFAFYFTTVVIGGAGGEDDLLWGLAVSLSALFVAITSPLLGAIADRGGARKRFMLFFTLQCTVAVSLFSILGPGTVVAGFLLFMVANIGFESALVFYNAYLPDIAPPHRRGWVSGLGYAFGYFGSALGLLMALPFASDRIDVVWFLVSGFFLLFSIPAFLALPADPRGGAGFTAAAKWGITGFKAIVREVWQTKQLRNFLFAFFFYIDGVLTIIVMAGRVATETFGFGPEETIVLFLMIQFSALAGSLALAKPTDTLGPRKVLNGVLILWMAVGVSAVFVESQRVFYVLAVIAGIGLGTVQAASRALMSSLIPDGKEAEMFGFYALCGKSSSVLGPLLFGGAAYLAGGNQRPGFLLLTGLFLLGFILLQRVDDPRLAPRAETTARA